MAVMLLSLPALVACNHDDKDDDSVYSYSDSEQTTLVTGFSLQPDAEVLASLDSVHFTIDYDNGLPSPEPQSRPTRPSIMLK